jgi:hypothetical protein
MVTNKSTLVTVTGHIVLEFDRNVSNELNKSRWAEATYTITFNVGDVDRDMLIAHILFSEEIYK